MIETCLKTQLKYEKLGYINLILTHYESDFNTIIEYKQFRVLGSSYRLNEYCDESSRQLRVIFLRLCLLIRLTYDNNYSQFNSTD